MKFPLEAIRVNPRKTRFSCPNSRLLVLLRTRSSPGSMPSLSFIECIGPDVPIEDRRLVREAETMRRLSVVSHKLPKALEKIEIVVLVVDPGVPQLFGVLTGDTSSMPHGKGVAAVGALHTNWFTSSRDDDNKA